MQSYKASGAELIMGSGLFVRLRRWKSLGRVDAVEGVFLSIVNKQIARGMSDCLVHGAHSALLS